MKAIVKLSFLFLITTVFLSSCKTNESNCNHENENKSCYPNNEKPSNVITYKEMANMFHQYDIGQKPILDAYRKNFSGNKEDVASISHFYEINQLKQYIAYLEKLSKEKDIKLTGVRIFSAAYPKDYRQDKSLSGRHSLIFMPTAKINGKDIAFEPLYSKKGKAVPFTKFLQQFSSKESKEVMRASFLPLLPQDDLLSSGANRLDVTPPY